MLVCLYKVLSFSKATQITASVTGKTIIDFITAFSEDLTVVARPVYINCQTSTENIYFRRQQRCLRHIVGQDTRRGMSVFAVSGSVRFNERVLGTHFVYIFSFSVAVARMTSADNRQSIRTLSSV